MKLTDTRSQTQRVMDKLRCSSPADGRRDIDRLAAQGGTVETNPTRTITNIYYGGSERKHGPDAKKEY
jgi:hypothetical protein